MEVKRLPKEHGRGKDWLDANCRVKVSGIKSRGEEGPPTVPPN